MAATLHDRLLTDIAALIAALNLQGQAGAPGNIGPNVYAQTLADGSANLQPVLFPNVRVTAEGQTEEEGGSNFEEDEVIYPCLILFCDTAQSSTQQARAVYRRWRHDVARALRGLVAYPLLLNCPELIEITVRGQASAAREAADKHKAVEGLVALCRTMEPREVNH